MERSRNGDFYQEQLNDWGSLTWEKRLKADVKTISRYLKDSHVGEEPGLFYVALQERTNIVRRC